MIKLTVVFAGLVFASSVFAQTPPPPAQPQPAQQQRGQRPQYPTIRYTLGADSMPQEGVPKGKLEGPFLFKSAAAFPGTVRKYWVYVPAQYDKEKPAAVLVFQDGARAINPRGVLRVDQVLENLIHRKQVPVTIGIFITPGQRGEEFPDSIGTGNPNNRSVEYDSVNDSYAKLVSDEIIPEVAKQYNLSKNPDDRAIGGASSGAIAAFAVAWYRPDEFRKVISTIGSFTNIRGGHVFPQMVRDTEKKPIRVFIQDGIYDNRSPQRPERDWYLQNQLMIQALIDKGYDLNVAIGAGGHSDDHGGAILPDILRWMFRDHPDVAQPGR